MTKLSLSLVAIFALTASCIAQTGHEPKNVTELYGKHLLKVVRNPDSVYAVLLDDNMGRLRERTKRILLSPEESQAASMRLTRNTAYGWDVWKPCLPQYGSRLIFQRGVDRVTVDFCFNCIILSVTPSAREEHDVDFGPSRKTWLQLFKTEFSKDKILSKVE